ncbi:MAG: DUF126 domain-containing protein [Nitrosopumilus sp.]|nr:DUF126 domain-containing protein [Nitrosopumilus sp.]CAI9832549.1 conserved hypothetical protein [Nitrosopumilaceae archaeon]MDA7941040.1 DUF126 domain-containing protein [Nitrosopumilus sp.]MDA7942562.1 DUF126 domain-containing protein [Nitrosopumilus sp.]MDA7944477.1 DUF126 domain-containing protein [Nitrosopumilus sp.]
MRVLVAGSARGVVLKSASPINFLGAVDRSTGVITDGSHELHGRSVRGTILAFPSGAGSSVGAYTIYSLKAEGAAPLAMVCARADGTVASGCAAAGIPLVASEEAYDILVGGAEAVVDTSLDVPVSRA